MWWSLLLSLDIISANTELLSRDVVFRKGSGSWVPSLIGIMVISIAFSLSVFWLQLYALMPISPGACRLFLGANTYA